jgi:hypothetical protein
MNTSKATHTLLWLAILLVAGWVILRLALAVTSVALHLLWIAGVVLFIIWLIGVIRGRGRSV